MRIVVVGKYKKDVEKEIPKFGLEFSKHPEIVVSYGGDGTILEAERKFPGIPKIFIKHSEVCINCRHTNYRNVLKRLQKRKFKIIKQIKVEGLVNGKKLIGLNEINIVSSKPIYAIRFDAYVNGRLIGRNMIGDGILVSTPFGSRAYFYSITRKSFKKGLGIAFNNLRKRMKPMVVNENSIIKVKILRDGGFMISDNNPKSVKLYAGDEVTIKKSKQLAKIVKL
ncbi:MAG: hypothetical protein V1944_02320 [Candidatus Aenigmatarchaeota archaeon]